MQINQRKVVSQEPKDINWNNWLFKMLTNENVEGNDSAYTLYSGVFAEAGESLHWC